MRLLADPPVRVCHPSFRLVSYNRVYHNGKRRIFLREFTTLRFFSQIIFISAILIHLLCATKPWMIKRGLLKYEERTADYILVYSIFSVLFLFALISYFIYWNF